MNETSQLDIVALDDAKEVTKGLLDPQTTGDHQMFNRRLED